MRVKSTLSKADKQRLDKATELAKLSDCKKRHGAVLISGGRTIAVGVNMYRNEQLPGISEFDFSTHAEISALRSLPRGTKLKNATIYVARIYADDTPAMSAPCDRCKAELKKFGIKKIVYTIDKEMTL